MTEMPTPQPTVAISQGLFNKIVNVLAELPFNRVGGLIGEIQQELNRAQIDQQRMATVANLMRQNSGEPVPEERKN